MAFDVGCGIISLLIRHAHLDSESETGLMSVSRTHPARSCSGPFLSIDADVAKSLDDDNMYQAAVMNLKRIKQAQGETEEDDRGGE